MIFDDIGYHKECSIDSFRNVLVMRYYNRWLKDFFYTKCKGGIFTKGNVLKKVHLFPRYDVSFEQLNLFEHLNLLGISFI